jgi:hypothetical protein
MRTFVVCLYLFVAGSAHAELAGRTPVYSHNDYLQPVPLRTALHLGVRGVEADYWVVDGALMVAHERANIVESNTLQSLYLDPLRQRIQGQGRVYHSRGDFILNIEAKEPGIEAYRALVAVLAQYPDILTVVRNGSVDAGHVQVVLVGWHPPLDELLAEEVRYVAVQSHYRDLPDDHERYPAHLLKMITQNYNDKMISRGQNRFARRLQAVVAATSAVPGRICRVYNVPTDAATYEFVLSAGVDMIGTKDIHGAYALVGVELGAIKTQ